MKIWRGFTLIELLVVISLIGFLSSIIYASLATARAKARDTARKQEVVEIRNAVNLYYLDKGYYPDSATIGGGPNTDTSICGMPFTSGGIVYMASLPCDPTTGWTYDYDADTPTVGHFTIAACLENARDPQADAVEDSNCSTPASFTLSQ